MEFKSILVSGSLFFEGDDRQLLQQFCRLLGKAIVRVPSFRLITGGMKGQQGGSVDYYTACGARDALVSHTLQKHKIVTSLPIHHSGLWETFSIGTIHRCPAQSPYERRLSLANQADYIVTVKGGPGTYELFAAARSIETPILPLGFTGGASFRLWNDHSNQCWIKIQNTLDENECLYLDNPQFHPQVAMQFCVDHLSKYFNHQLESVIH